jgi:hypothetical protein
MTHRALITLALAAGFAVLPLSAASGQDKIYPPGTDCANQPTIAERLLCGRQEFRRQSETSVPQPAPPPNVDGQPERAPPLTSPMDETTPLLAPNVSQGGAASSHH